MTNPNNAAQAAEQEIDAIMEQAQVFASAWAFLGGPLDNGSGLEQAEREKANLRALLSKLRAPADERLSVEALANDPFLAARAWREPKASAPVAGEAQEHYDEVKATLQGAHRIMESLSAIERRVGPVGSHARGYTHKITAALHHLDALYAASQVSATNFTKLQSAFVGACDRIGELLAEKQRSAPAAPL